MANQYDTNLKLQAIADAIGDTQSSGLIQALEDIADAVAGGGGGSSAGLVSDNFSETDTYDLGDYCIHNNTMYVCINAITTPGPWDLSDWQATNAGIQLSSLNSALDNKLSYIDWANPNELSGTIDYVFTEDSYFECLAVSNISQTWRLDGKIISVGDSSGGIHIIYASGFAKAGQRLTGVGFVKYFELL